MTSSEPERAAAGGERTTASASQLTPRQREVLAFIEEHIDAHGYPPTGRELSDACGLGGPSGAQRMLQTLERKGFISRSPGRSRALALVHPEIDAAALDEEDLHLLSAMAEGQAVERDCVLAAASKVTDQDVKRTLIEEALERHDQVTRVEAVLAQSSSARPETLGAMEAVLTGLRSGSSWESFVVDQVIYNHAAGPVARVLAERVPPLANVLRHTAELCDRSAESAERWLETIVERSSDEAIVELRTRAVTMARVHTLTARSLRRTEAGGKFPDVASVRLPRALTPAYVERPHRRR